MVIVGKRFSRVDSVLVHFFLLETRIVVHSISMNVQCPVISRNSVPGYCIVIGTGRRKKVNKEPITR